VYPRARCPYSRAGSCFSCCEVESMGTSQRRAHPSRAVRALMCVALHWKSMRERLGNGDFEPPRRQDDHHRRESRTSLASGHAAVTPLPSPHPAAVWANATQDRRLRSIVDCDVDGGAAPVPTSNRQLVSVVPSGGAHGAADSVAGASRRRRCAQLRPCSWHYPSSELIRQLC
jgi:hypothetical protein